MKKQFLLGFGLAALVLAACGREAVSAANDEAAAGAGEPASSDPGANAPGASDPGADNLAASIQYLEENAKREGVQVTQTGLQYQILEEGPPDGATPVSTDRVVVHYVGTLKDGLEFDSSRARGAAASFQLNKVIPGWTEGLQLMSEGDRFRFFLPPDMGYGARGTPGGPIGPNEALIFEVELIKVHSPEANLAAANEFLTANLEKDGVKATQSGLQYEIISEGGDDGASPSAADNVRVHYKGTLLNGTEFDSSYARGQPAEFPLNRVIAGWTEGLQLMSEGDKFRFFIPPDLAYGELGTPNGPIGPNEALIFEVELIAVK